MRAPERRQRWKAMMDVLRTRDIHAWRRDYLAALESA
jgi:trehalose 6-phosphate synthase